MSDDSLTYQKAGVDPEKAASILSRFAGFVGSRPRDPNLLSGIGGFASCYSLKSILSTCEDPLLVTCCDGVGTKAKLALDWGKIEGLGQDLLAMNVNDLLCTGATPLLFLDYYACGSLKEDQLTTLLKSIQAACELAGCSLAGGETAEMPGLYAGEDFDLAGFSVGVVDRSKLLGPARVQGGDRLLALESAGLHSNGFSLVRKVVEKAGLRKDDLTPFSHRKWSDVLLKPTTVYVKAMQGILGSVHAAAHITGGGLYENLPRVLRPGQTAIVSSSAWGMPDLFLWLQEQAGLDTKEMLSTFNCGVGMILMLPENALVATIEHLKQAGIRSWEIGEITEDDTGSPPSVLWK